MGISDFSSCARLKNISSAIFIALCECKLKNDLLEIPNRKSHGNSLVLKSGNDDGGCVIIGRLY